METRECPGCRERDARLTVAEARILKLEGMVRDLQDKLAALTKSPPPPRVVEGQPEAPVKKPTGRKPGGQPGHPHHLKKLLPTDQVRYLFPLIPLICKHCDTALPQGAGPNDSEPTRHQIYELPRIAAVVTEYQGHSRTCPCCKKVTTEPIPDAIRDGIMGPQFTATLSYFAGCHGMSKRGIEEVAETLFGVPIALGTVSNLEREMAEALNSPFQEARDAVIAAAVKHLAEEVVQMPQHRGVSICGENLDGHPNTKITRKNEPGVPHRIDQSPPIRPPRHKTCHRVNGYDLFWDGRVKY